MELQQLAYFVAICETGSMTRAAETLFVSQQALSKSMRDLSADLGAPLFSRTARGVTLTPCGQALWPRAQKMLEDAQAMRQAVIKARDGEFRQFCLGYLVGSYNFQSALPVEVVSALERRFAPVSIQVCEYLPEELIGLLLRGDLHAAYGVNLVSGPGLLALALAREPLCALFSERHPLADRPSIRQDDLRGNNLLLSAQTPFSPELFAAFESLPEVTIQRLPGTLMNLVEHIRLNQGFTLAGRAFFMSYNLTGLRILPLTDMPPMRHDLLVRRDRDMLPGPAREIISALCESALPLK